MEKEKKEIDVLEQLKQAEKVIKVNLLIKKIGELKKVAKEVLVAKEKTQMILEEAGVKGEDIKRVIDFINSMPEVQLTEAEKKDLREDVRESNTESKKQIQKLLEDKPFYIPQAAMGQYAGYAVVNQAMGTATSGLTSCNFNSSTGSLDIKL
jgi:hypothetical protein